MLYSEVEQLLSTITEVEVICAGHRITQVQVKRTPL